jgi:hypothetical protein
MLAPHPHGSAQLCRTREHATGAGEPWLRSWMARRGRALPCSDQWNVVGWSDRRGERRLGGGAVQQDDRRRGLDEGGLDRQRRDMRQPGAGAVSATMILLGIWRTIAIVVVIAARCVAEVVRRLRVRPVRHRRLPQSAEDEEERENGMDDRVAHLQIKIDESPASAQYRHPPWGQLPRRRPHAMSITGAHVDIQDCELVPMRAEVSLVASVMPTRAPRQCPFALGRLSLDTFGMTAGPSASIDRISK